ncbi:DUF4169 family protein [Pontibaca methylaminivorans]|uniref:DUF4169 domain-containing protein n=1 Tax=Pontibaca methylaminivorans TaxID=515897 RepID=A0A1R3WM77_9RHOB|nr:DUF4169 family protein [Pontibaca methylaminivorans]SIT79007.1 protein of unknown function [Pontibaca methylaminivorans]
MAEVVNLNRARKQRARAARKQRGDENAMRFGRGKAGRALDHALQDRAARALDGHRLEQDHAGDHPARRRSGEERPEE